MRTWRSENFFSSSRVRLGGAVSFCVEVVFGGSCVEGGYVPLLDFVKAWEKRHGDEDDDCFLAVADVDLCDGLVVSRGSSSKRPYSL